MNDAALPMTDVRAEVSEEEWALRVELAAAYRLIAHFGWDDVIYTHLSVRIPGPEHHFLLNPYNLMFEEITASSLVKVDQAGEAVMSTPYCTNPAGFVIHSALHMSREDAQAVMHLHTSPGQAVSALEEGLLPLTQTAMVIHQDTAYHEYEGIALDMEERERLIADMGDKNCMILRNHGTLSVGPSIGAAFMRLYYLERACEAQVMALSGGRPLSMPPQGAPRKVAEQVKTSNTATTLAWPALLRKADRLDPSYRA